MANMQERCIWVKLIFDGESQPTMLLGTSTEFSNGATSKIIKTSSKTNDLSINAMINIPGGYQSSNANIVIKGMLLDDINAFSRANMVYGFNMLSNTVQIFAGYDTGDEQPPFVYQGSVVMAAPDQNDPSRPFRIYSQQNTIDQNTMLSATNPKGVVQINDLFANLAQQLGYSYQPNNVTGQVSNPILIGSAIHQLNQLANDYGYQIKLDNNILMVTKIGTAYSNNVIEINPDNGMLGYPTVNEFSINVRVRYNPAIKFGQTVRITSGLELANGEWWVNGVTHLLQNQESKFETVLTLLKTNPLGGTT